MLKYGGAAFNSSVHLFAAVSEPPLSGFCDKRHLMSVGYMDRGGVGYMDRGGVGTEVVWGI
jgi:hypothetical protein